ncbi:MAG: tRNA modification GTPase [Bacteroidota bacterium]|nr:tRNA modification GTPase [Bacteroidota bacterium]
MERTIAALATPAGIGGIAVIRISGDEAIVIADKLFIGKTSLSEAKTHTIHYGSIISNGIVVDTVTAAIFRAPNSYTGENVVEISCHGGYLVSGEILSTLYTAGASEALPGEFTRRAFINGRMDLTQVEAVADLIHSISVPGAASAVRQLLGGFTEKIEIFRQSLLDIASLLELELDFADEAIEFTQKTEIIARINEARDFCIELSQSYRSAEVLRKGYHVGLAGYPNSGKSTLFNALLGRKRAIVSDIPGTTRDYLEDYIYLRNIPIKLIDTAGIRSSGDFIEIEGIELAESMMLQSDLILVLNDCAISPANSDKLLTSLKEKIPETEIIIIQNKIDIPNIELLSNMKSIRGLDIFLSAKKGMGVEELKEIIGKKASNCVDMVKDGLINRRHTLLLSQAAEALLNAVQSIETGFENEIISIDIRKAAKLFGEFTGESWNDDVLNNVFSRFCIGK